MSNLRSVEFHKPAPFGGFIDHQLGISREGEREISSPRYLAWQLVRNPTRNPYFNNENATGFEGYYVGHVENPTQVFEELLNIGRKILTSLMQEFQHDYGKRKRLLNALDGQNYADKNEIAYWDEVFGAELAKMKATRLYPNPITSRFREATYACLTGNKAIIYEADKRGNVVETYQIPTNPPEPNPSVRGNRPKFNLETAITALNENDAIAWKIVSRIGMFGDPALRMALRKAFNN